MAKRFERIETIQIVRGLSRTSKYEQETARMLRTVLTSFSADIASSDRRSPGPMRYLEKDSTTSDYRMFIYTSDDRHIAAVLTTKIREAANPSSQPYQCNYLAIPYAPNFCTHIIIAGYVGTFMQLSAGKSKTH